MTSTQTTTAITTTQTTSLTTTATTTEVNGFFFASETHIGPLPTLIVGFGGDCVNSTGFLMHIANSVAQQYREASLDVAYVRAKCADGFGTGRKRSLDSSILINVTFGSWADLKAAESLDLDRVPYMEESYVMEDTEVAGFTELGDGPPHIANVVVFQYTAQSNVRTRQAFGSAGVSGSTCGYPVNATVLHENVIIRVYTGIQPNDVFDVPSSPAHRGRMLIRLEPQIPLGYDSTPCPGADVVLDTSCESDLLIDDEFGPLRVAGFQQGELNTLYCPMLSASQSCAASSTTLKPCDFCEVAGGAALQSLTFEYHADTVSASFGGKVDVTLRLNRWAAPYTYHGVSDGDTFLFSPTRFNSLMSIEISQHSDRCSPGRCIEASAIIDLGCASRLAIGDRLAAGLHIKAYTIVDPTQPLPTLSTSHCPCESVSSSLVCGPSYGGEARAFVFEYTGFNCDPADLTCDEQHGALRSFMSVEGQPPQQSTGMVSIAVYKDFTQDRRLVKTISAEPGEQFRIGGRASRLVFIIRDQDHIVSTVTIDTSCESPLRMGNTYGSMKLLDADRNDLSTTSAPTDEPNDLAAGRANDANNVVAGTANTYPYAAPFFVVLAILVISMAIYIGHRRRRSRAALEATSASSGVEASDTSSDVGKQRRNVVRHADTASYAGSQIPKSALIQEANMTWDDYSGAISPTALASTFHASVLSPATQAMLNNPTVNAWNNSPTPSDAGLPALPPNSIMSPPMTGRVVTSPHQHASPAAMMTGQTETRQVSNASSKSNASSSWSGASSRQRPQGAVFASPQSSLQSQQSTQQGYGGGRASPRPVPRNRPVASAISTATLQLNLSPKEIGALSFEQMMPHHDSRDANISAASPSLVASPRNEYFDQVRSLEGVEGRGQNPLYDENDDDDDDDNDNDNDAYAAGATLSPQRAVDTLDDDRNTELTSPLSPQKQWEEAMVSRMDTVGSTASVRIYRRIFCLPLLLIPRLPASVTGFGGGGLLTLIGLAHTLGSCSTP